MIVACAWRMSWIRRWGSPASAVIRPHVRRRLPGSIGVPMPVAKTRSRTAVSGPSRDGRFTVTAWDDGPIYLETRNVVVASGLLRIPKIPTIARSVPAGITQLHAGAYRRPPDLPSGAVVIVCSGQSGVQIAEDLLAAGRTVYLSTSAVPRLRRRYRGRDSLEWLVDGGTYDVPLDRLPDPQVRFQTLFTTSGIGRFGHTVSLQALEERGAILLGRPAPSRATDSGSTIGSGRISRSLTGSRPSSTRCSRRSSVLRPSILQLSKPIRLTCRTRIRCPSGRRHRSTSERSASAPSSGRPDLAETLAFFPCPCSLSRARRSRSTVSVGSRGFISLASRGYRRASPGSSWASTRTPDLSPTTSLSDLRRPVPFPLREGRAPRLTRSHDENVVAVRAPLRRREAPACLPVNR